MCAHLVATAEKALTLQLPAPSELSTPFLVDQMIASA